MNEISSTTESVRGNRKSRVGQVVSDVQSKTIVVEVESRSPHKRYKKVVTLLMDTKSYEFLKF